MTFEPKYAGKDVVFNKPLFPGYVFLLINNESRKVALSSSFVANILYVVEQQLFNEQLNVKKSIIINIVWTNILYEHPGLLLVNSCSSRIPIIRRH